MEKLQKFRIYGNTLGTMQDVIFLLMTIELNYDYILMCDNLLTTSEHNYRIKSFLKKYEAQENSVKREFIDFYNNLGMEDLISVEERLVISSTNFNSPRFWDIIGSLNPLSQIRDYIQERDLRKREQEFLILDKETKNLENEKIKLQNDILKLDITQKMINQLREIGFSNDEMLPIIKEYYSNLELLNPHIDSGRITSMEIVNSDKI